MSRRMRATASRRFHVFPHLSPFPCTHGRGVGGEGGTFNGMLCPHPRPLSRSTGRGEKTVLESPAGKPISTMSHREKRGSSQESDSWNCKRFTHAKFSTAAA